MLSEGPLLGACLPWVSNVEGCMLSEGACSPRVMLLLGVCPSWVSNAEGCPPRVPSKGALQGCPPRVPSNGACSPWVCSPRCLSPSMHALQGSCSCWVYSWVSNVEGCIPPKGAYPPRVLSCWVLSKGARHTSHEQYISSTREVHRYMRAEKVHSKFFIPYYLIL